MRDENERRITSRPHQHSCNEAMVGRTGTSQQFRCYSTYGKSAERVLFIPRHSLTFQSLAPRSSPERNLEPIVGVNDHLFDRRSSKALQEDRSPFRYRLRLARETRNVDSTAGHDHPHLIESLLPLRPKRESCPVSLEPALGRYPGSDEFALRPSSARSSTLRTPCSISASSRSGYTSSRNTLQPATCSHAGTGASFTER
jgi:hypothetical protein